MQIKYVLDKLKEKEIMSAVIGLDGTQVASNFTTTEGLESYVSSSFNVADALLREAGEAATEVVVSTNGGNLVLKKVDKGILMSLIKTKDQYAFYKEVVGGEGKKNASG